MGSAGTARCPFKPGDWVYYRPSRRGYDLDVMSTERLTVGARYKIERIDSEMYVVVEGYTHPGGGIYWTEFAPASPK